MPARRRGRRVPRGATALPKRRPCWRTNGRGKVASTPPRGLLRSPHALGDVRLDLEGTQDGSLLQLQTSLPGAANGHSRRHRPAGLAVSVVLPCLNEEASIE